jgi:hypothetical protein
VSQAITPTEEKKRVNFTIETMTQIAHALGRHPDLHVLKNDEEGSRLS